MTLVIDASVTLAWCLEDEQSDYAETIFSRLTGERATVPSLWAVEVANGLRNAERRDRLSPAGAAEAHGLLSRLPVEIEETSLYRVLVPVLNVARTNNLSAYDASYLELAMREGLALATVDDRLRAAAARVGVTLA